MFDIGFMELVLVGIVALLVVGPERLPGAVRTASLWIGRAKRSFNQVRAEIEREINADEIRRQLHNESILADIEKAKKQADTLVKDARQNLDKINTEVNATLKKEEAELKALVDDAPATSAPLPADIETETAGSAASNAPEPEPTPEPTPEPVVDFYNNPPSGIIQLKGGVFQQVPPTSTTGEEDENRERQEKP